MRKPSGRQRKALAFWLKNIKSNTFVIKGSRFPDEYSRKFLSKEDLLVRLKRGLYALKNRGARLEDIIFHIYWQIVSVFLADYEPWAIEKESALKLHLGDESLPSALIVRSAKTINYGIEISPGLKIQVHPDHDFNGKTRQIFKLDQTRLYVDVPERVLFTIKNRQSAKLKAFIKAFRFNRTLLEALYENNPKPVVAKTLIHLSAKLNPRLSETLKDIVGKFTVYRT
jgi:hypothetical protein